MSRQATTDLKQLPDGRWHVHLTAKSPALPALDVEAIHPDAGTCLHWVQTQLHIWVGAPWENVPPVITKVLPGGPA